MKKSFTSFVETCTRPLADDVAMRLEVEQELEGHLEEAYEEECTLNHSDQEAQELAIKRFGDPEELSQSILLANLKKFTCRARIKRIIKIATIPFLLIGILLAVDLRMVKSFLMLDMFSDYNSTSSWHDLRDYTLKLFHKYDLRNVPEEKKQLVYQYLNIEKVEPEEFAKKLYESNVDNPVYTAFYARELTNRLSNNLSNTKITPELQTQIDEFNSIIKNGRRIDPENALYDYLECHIALLPTMLFEYKTKSHLDNPKVFEPTFDVTIFDRAALDNAMKLYLAGLNKPFLKNYNLEIPQEVYSLVNPQNDYCGMLERVNIFSRALLSNLNMNRQLGLKVIFYGKTLDKEGKKSESEQYLQSWNKYLSQLTANNSSTLIEVLFYHRIAKAFQESATKLGNTAETNKLAQVCTPIDSWREKKDPNNKNIKIYAGIMSAMFIPVLKEEIPIEEFTADRLGTYLNFDLMLLSIFSLFITLLVFVYAIILGVNFLRGKYPFFIFMSKKSYLKILLLGIIVPLSVWYIYNHIDFLGGRNMSILANMPRILFGQGFLLFGLPLIFYLVCWRELKQYEKLLGFARGKIPIATYCLNMLIFLIGLLVITSGILRPLLKSEAKYYAARDQILNSKSTFSCLEEKVTHDLSQQFYQTLNKVK